MRKVLRQIQRHHRTGIKLKTSDGTTQQYQAIFHALLPQQFDATLGFLNEPNTIRQCMNAVNPRQASTHHLSPVTTIRPNSYAKKSRKRFSPVFIPGTPDATSSDRQEEQSSDARAEHEWNKKELEHIDLYYKIFNRNRPEPGESNSEAAARHQAIND